MSFKKSFTVLLTLSLIIILAGCGGGSGGAGTGNGLTTTGTVSLTWDAPTTRADGTSLNPATDIATYKLYYGTSSGNYSQSIDVKPNLTAPYTTTDTVTLGSGTYYFAVTAVDTSGNESAYSADVMRTL
jgi:hypothetical protein